MSPGAGRNVEYLLVGINNRQGRRRYHNIRFHRTRVATTQVPEFISRIKGSVPDKQYTCRAVRSLFHRSKILIRKTVRTTPGVYTRMIDKRRARCQTRRNNAFGMYAPIGRTERNIIAKTCARAPTDAVRRIYTRVFKKKNNVKDHIGRYWMFR